jgi:hypothetical protein
MRSRSSDLGSAPKGVLRDAGMTWGQIASTGVIQSGSGDFTVVKNGSGNFTVTFNRQRAAFSTLVTCYGLWSNVCYLNSVSSTGFNVQVANNAGANTDNGFQFAILPA